MTSVAADNALAAGGRPAARSRKTGQRYGQPVGNEINLVPARFPLLGKGLQPGITGTISVMMIEAVI